MAIAGRLCHGDRITTTLAFFNMRVQPSRSISAPLGFFFNSAISRCSSVNLGLPFPEKLFTP
jgi:hypothetical protein